MGAIAGALIGGWAIEYFGRKTALMIYSVPFATGWLLISNAQHGWMVLLGRLLTGVAVGATSLTVPVSCSFSSLYVQPFFETDLSHPLSIYAHCRYQIQNSYFFM